MFTGLCDRRELCIIDALFINWSEFFLSNFSLHRHCGEITEFNLYGIFRKVNISIRRKCHIGLWDLILPFTWLTTSELTRWNTTLKRGSSEGRRHSFGPLFTKWADVLLQDLVKSQRREIRVKLFWSLWNLAGTSAAALHRCLSNFR